MSYLTKCPLDEMGLDEISWTLAILRFFSTVFQSNQDDGWVIAIEPRLRLKRFSPQTEIEPGTARSAGQCLTY